MLIKGLQCKKSLNSWGYFANFSLQIGVILDWPISQLTKFFFFFFFFKIQEVTAWPPALPGGPPNVYMFCGMIEFPLVEVSCIDCTLLSCLGGYNRWVEKGNQPGYILPPNAD